MNSQTVQYTSEPVRPDDISVQAFMYSIAAELGRPTKDVQPFVDELQQRWYMRVSQLREIPSNVWREINVPPGLLQIIYKKLEQLQSKPISPAIAIPTQSMNRNTNNSLPPVKKMETLEKKIINEVVGAHHPGVNPFEVIDPLTIKCHCCAKEINIKKGLFALTRHVQGSSCKGESRHAQNLCVWMAKSQRDGMLPLAQRMPMQMSPKDSVMIKPELPECPSGDDSERMEALSSPIPSSPERSISPGDSPSKRKEPEPVTQDEEMERRCKCGVPAKVFKLKTDNDQYRLAWKCSKSVGENDRCDYFCFWNVQSELPKFQNELPKFEQLSC